MPHLYGLQPPVRDRVRILLRALYRRIEQEGALPVRAELRRIGIYADALKHLGYSVNPSRDWQEASSILREEISKRLAPHHSINAWLHTNHRDFYVALHKKHGLVQGTKRYKLAWIGSLIAETTTPPIPTMEVKG